jgi:IS66 Orf2 like protein
VLTLPRSVRIFISSGATDMRRSIDGLMSIVKDELEGEVYSGHLYVFVSRRADRVKILTWDKGGFVLYYNQLSSHYTSFDWTRGSWSRPSASRTAAARSLTRSHRLQCFVGCVAGSS